MKRKIPNYRKYKDGGTLPISDPSEYMRRQRAYQDSLYLYNKGRNEARAFENNKFTPPHTPFNSNFGYSDLVGEYNYNEGFSSAKNIKSRKIKPKGAYNVEGLIPYYKKPTQPVEYRPEQSKVDSPKASKQQIKVYTDKAEFNKANRAYKDSSYVYDRYNDNPNEGVKEGKFTGTVKNFTEKGMEGAFDKTGNTPTKPLYYNQYTDKGSDHNPDWKWEKRTYGPVFKRPIIKPVYQEPVKETPAKAVQQQEPQVTPPYQSGDQYMGSQFPNVQVVRDKQGNMFYESQGRRIPYDRTGQNITKEFQYADGGRVSSEANKTRKVLNPQEDNSTLAQAKRYHKYSPQGTDYSPMDFSASPGTATPLYGANDPLFNLAMLGYGWGTSAARNLNKVNPTLGEFLERGVPKTSSVTAAKLANKEYVPGAYNKKFADELWSPPEGVMKSGSADMSYSDWMNSQRIRAVHGEQPLLKDLPHAQEYIKPGENMPGLAAVKGPIRGIPDHSNPALENPDIFRARASSPAWKAPESVRKLRIQQEAQMKEPVNALELYQDYSPHKRGGRIRRGYHGLPRNPINDHSLHTGTDSGHLGYLNTPITYGLGGTIGSILGGGAAIGLTALTGGAAAPLTIPMAASAFGLGSQVGGGVGSLFDSPDKSMQAPQEQQVQQVPQSGLFENGGMLNPGMEFVPINIEGSSRQQGTRAQLSKGELLTRGGKILKNYTSYSPHPSSGVNPDSNVQEEEGAIVIPKKRTQEYLNSDRNGRKMIERSLVSQQQRRELSARNILEKGGYIFSDYQDEPMSYEVGQQYDISDDELENLRSQGYKFNVL